MALAVGSALSGSGLQTRTVVISWTTGNEERGLGEDVAHICENGVQHSLEESGDPTQTSAGSRESKGLDNHASDPCETILGTVGRHSREGPAARVYALMVVHVLQIHGL